MTDMPRMPSTNDTKNTKSKFNFLLTVNILESKDEIVWEYLCDKIISNYDYQYSEFWFRITPLKS